MIVIPTGTFEEKAKAALNFQVFNDVREIFDLVKKVGVDLVHVMNTVVPDSRFSRAERFECVCQSILVALDDAEKVGTKLLEESIAIEKTKDALKRIAEARDFVKNQLPAMLDLSLVSADSLADGRLELREVVAIADAAKKVDWSALTACFGFLVACVSKKAVSVEVPAPVPVPVVIPPLPESPTPEPPLPQPPKVPEPQEVPEPPQSSESPPQTETKPENDEVDHP